jgi:hypothetical protein
MKLWLVALCFCLSTMCGLAQKHSVVGSTGGIFSSSNGTLEWTLGEISVETYQSVSGFLTQGFHQTWASPITGIERGEGVTVYPNPATRGNSLYIKTLTPGSYEIELFNALGKKLTSKEESILLTENYYQLDISELEAAIYLLRVRNTTTGQLYTLKKIIIL